MNLKSSRAVGFLKCLSVGSFDRCLAAKTLRSATTAADRVEGRRGWNALAPKQRLVFDDRASLAAALPTPQRIFLYIRKLLVYATVCNGCSIEIWVGTSHFRSTTAT